jgi:hypothetical protein
MKRILLFVLPTIIAFGCSDDDDTNACGLELKLVKITSSWTGDEAAGDEMSWQETIVLSNDSTFLKRRNAVGTVTEATGHYTYITRDGKKYVELTYDQNDSALRASCSPTLTDLIEVKSNKLFINSDWQHCDGPILDYTVRAASCEEYVTEMD